MKKRIIALILVVTLLVSSAGNPFQSRAYYANAEEETQQSDQSQTDQLEKDQPAGEQPAADQPRADQPDAVQPAAEQPTTNQPTAEQPDAVQPAADQPTANQPDTAQPAADQPDAVQPAEEQTTAVQPSADQAAAEQPTTNQPTADQPDAVQPAADQTTAVQPSADQAAAEQPTTNQPNADQPTAEQPDQPSAGSENNQNSKDGEEKAGEADHRSEAAAAEEPIRKENVSEEAKYEATNESVTEDGVTTTEEQDTDEGTIEGLSQDENTTENPTQDETATAEKQNEEKEKSKEQNPEEEKSKEQTEDEEKETELTLDEKKPSEQTEAEAENPEPVQSQAEYFDPAGDDPAGDDPTGGDPAGDDPAGDVPAGYNPTGDNPAGDNPTGDNSTGDNSTGDNPAGDDPTDDNPAGDNPTGDDPAAETEPQERESLQTSEISGAGQKTETLQIAAAKQNAVKSVPLTADAAETKPETESPDELKDQPADGEAASGDEASAADSSASGNQKETDDPADNEEENEEEPVLTSGMRTLKSVPLLGAGSGKGAGNGTSDSGTTMTALEQIISAKFAEMSELSGTVRIILNNNTTYKGDSTITAGQRTVKDDFALELVASDAGEDGTKGNGQTVIDGNLKIQGIKVIMQSIVMAAGKVVTVQNAIDAAASQQSRGGALEYTATENLPTDLTAEVKDHSSLKVNAVDGNDKITVTSTTGAKEVSINAGNGLNKILATVSGGSLNVETGKDQDDVEVRIVGTANSADAASKVGNVTVDTGAGNDQLYILNNGQSANETRQYKTQETVTEEVDGETKTYTVDKTVREGIVISSGSGEDTVTLDVRSNAGTMILNTGDGGDTVTLRKGDLNTAEDLDYNHVFEPYETVRSDASTTKIILNNGDIEPTAGTDAVDQVTIDVSVARAVREIELQGGRGASIHLKGMLASSASEDERIKWADDSRTKIQVLASTVLSPRDAHALTVSVHPDSDTAYNFTDKLTNKKQQTLYIGAAETDHYTAELALADFTDYVIKSPVSGVNRISILNTNTANPVPFLSNLVLDRDETQDDNDTITVHNIYNGTEDAPAPIPLNLLVKAPTIEFAGTVYAQNVRAESVQGSSVFDYAATLSRGLDDTIDNAINIYDCAEVIVNKGAEINTVHDTSLTARVKHFGGAISMAWLMEIVNVKVATAAVRIDGRIQAGGSLTADAKIETQEGKKIIDYEGEAGNPAEVRYTDGDAVPLGIKFVMNDASVEVGRSAEISAGEDVMLRSRSDISVLNYENGTLPFAIAMTYINNDVKTIVEGSIQARRSVLISADGNIKSDAQANHRDDTENGSANVFVAMNIVDQDVDAVIRGGRVTAGADITVHANAVAEVKSIASASAMQKNVASKLPEVINPVNITITGLRGVFFGPKAGYNWVRGKLRSADYYTKKLEKMVNKISAGNYDVSVAGLSAENDEKGTASVKVKVSKYTAGDANHPEGEVPEGQEGGVNGLFAVVDAKPKAGYAVRKVQYRYLEKESESFTYVSVLPNDRGEYIFALKYPDTPYEVIVTYMEAGGQPDADANGERASINLDDLEDGYDINGLMEEANGAAEDAEQAEEQERKTGKDYVAVAAAEGKTVVNLFIIQPTEGGADTKDRILTWQTVPNADGNGEKSLDKVYAGQEIRFIGNPNANTKELKTLTLKYWVKSASTGTEIETETVLKPNSLGRFVFTVPENIVLTDSKGNTHNIAVEGTFGPKASTAGPSHNQVTGSLGFSYVNNQGNAVIESGETEEVSEWQTLKINGVPDSSIDRPADDPEDEKIAIGKKITIVTPEVTAGRRVDMLGIHTTNVETVADGSAVKEKPAVTVSADEGKPQETQKVKWTIPGTDYAVRVTSNLDGDITTAMTKGQDDEDGHATFSHPTFTFTPAAGKTYQDFHVQVSYYTKFNLSLTVGKRVTDDYSYKGATIHPDPETTVTLKHTDGGLTVTVTKGTETKSYTVTGTEAYTNTEAKFSVSADRKTITFGDGEAAKTFSTKISDGDLTVDSSTGKITFKPSLAKMAVVEGTTLDVSFVFQDEQGKPISDGNGTSKYAIANPINIQFNGLKRNKDLAATFLNDNLIEMGTVTYHNTITDTSTGALTYQFAVKANAGYKIDSKSENYVNDHKSNTKVLYASWIGADGLSHKQALVRDESSTLTNAEVWNFKMSGNSGIPAGATVSITAVFEKDARAIVVDPVQTSAGGEAAGDVRDKVKTTLSKTKVAATDKFTVKVTLNDDALAGEYAASGVRWHVEGSSESHMVTLDQNGQASITIPEDAIPAGTSARIIVVPIVTARIVTLSPAENIVLNEKKKGYLGEKVKVTLSEDELLQGKKISKILVNGTAVAGTDSFTIPNDAGNGTLDITVETRDGEYGIESYTAADGLGSIVPVCARADNGETVQLKIKPKAGYRAQYNSVTVTLVSNKRSRKITAAWSADNLYTFDLNLDEGEKLTAPIKVEGKFESGEDGIALSAGVAAAIGIIKGVNNVEIRDGNVTAGESLSMVGSYIRGKAATEARAGYSAGKTGVAGALGVQIASAQNNIIIHHEEALEHTAEKAKKQAAQAANAKLVGNDGLPVYNPDFDILNLKSLFQTYTETEKPVHGRIMIGKETTGADGKTVFAPGSITLKGNIKQDFKVTGDAANKKETAAKGTGVGAGIAVAIDQVTGKAEIEDGVWLDTDTLRSLSIKSKAKITDRVTAKAGAVGGSAFVPVAAVDIYKNVETARLGQLKKPSSAAEAAELDILNITGGAEVAAESVYVKTLHNHEVTADASARGGKTTLGGAFVVTWMSTDVRAELNQGLKADGDVKISSSSAEALKAVAAAAVSGGQKGKTDGNGEGSSDKQANKILNNAAGMAGKYGNMDGNAIMADGKNRQKAETAESSLAGAGAIALNIMKNKSRAEILDGVDVETAMALKVTSNNRTEASIRANASTTKSDTGVGVGIALNIVTIDNIARIGTGIIRAGELELRAEMADAPSYALEVRPTESKTPFAEQVRAAVEDGLKKLLGDNVVSSIATSALGSAAERITVRVMEDLNLTKLFSSVGDNALDTVINKAEQLGERIKGLPMTLISPLWLLIQQTVGTVAGWDRERFGNLFEDVWTTASIQLLGNTAGVTRAVLQESMGSLINSAINMVNRSLIGEGFDIGILLDKLKSTASNVYDRVVEKTVQDVIKRMSAEIPLMTESNMQLTREMKDLSFQKIKESIVPYLTKTIRDQIWDYEPVVLKIQEKGFKEFLKNEARALLNESTSAMTNSMIESITGKLDIQFTRELTADRHIITTQAISGAGAKTDSGAGSLAIAVVNMETRAEIAAGTNPVTVTGDMTLNAEELHRVRTHATAAVDARNDGDPLEAQPDNNEGVGDIDQADTGSANAACPNSVESASGVVAVSYSNGGQVTLDADQDGIIHLTPDAGYVNPEKVNATWTTKGGVQVHRELNIDIVNHSFDVFEDFDNPDDIAKIEVEIVFGDQLFFVPVPEHDENLVRGSVSVENRDPDGEGRQYAKPGELVQVKVPKLAGQKVDNITYSFYEHPSLEKKTYSLKENPAKFTLISENKNETVYGFTMPLGNMDDLEFTMVQAEGEQGENQDDEWEEAELPDDYEPETKAKDGAGRSIGVGAAFALTYGNSDVIAQIGDRKSDSGNRGTVTAGTLTVTASSEHEEENFSTAGTDPFEGTSAGQQGGAGEKKTGIDASVAVNILDNDIYAGITEGTSVKTTAAAEKQDGQEEKTKEDSGEETASGEDEPEEIEVTRGGLIISATEVARNETRASAFATGSTTSVGASAAVNVSLSDIEARLGSGADAAGKVVVRSHSLSRDNTWSFASAMGADMQRALNKAAAGAEKTEKTANDLTTGKFFEKKQGEGNNTGNRIADGMNRNQAEDGQEARGDLAVSVNALRNQGARADGGQDGQNAVNDPNDGDNALNNVNNEAGQNLTGLKSSLTEAKLQVAATVAVTVANHKAKTRVYGDVTAGNGKIELTSYNAGNFRTRATAAAMSMAAAVGGGKDIALAVGISVNKNEAVVDVKGNLKAPEGDVKAAADLKQNLTDEYRGYLAVQAVSGSFSGMGYDYSIAGALGMAISHAVSRATVEKPGASEAAPAAIQGRDVSITANDRSKLAIRAGGINISKGANKGAGVSIATIWSGNTVKASVADNTEIEAEGFTLQARKEKVTYGDFQWPIGMKNFLTDSSELNDEQRQNVKTGLIDVHRKPGEKSYTVDINVNSYALMNFVDALNFLSSQNYYTEAIAGSVSAGQAKIGTANALNMAGSFSIVRTKNDISAILGKNVNIRQRKDASGAAEVTVSATGDTTARLIGGAISAGSAKTAAGVTVTFQYNNDEVRAEAGKGLKIQADGAVKVHSSADMDVLTINAASAVSTEAIESSKAAGGSLDIILLKNRASTLIGDNASVRGGSVEVTADADMNLLMIIVSAMGASKGIAAGGTVAWTDDRAEALATLGQNHRLEAAEGDISIHAKTVDRVVSAAASASVGLDATGDDGKAYAGTLNILHSRAKALTSLGKGGNGHGLIAAKGSVSVAGETETRGVNATLAAAGGKAQAIGLNLNFNFFTRKSGVSIAGGDGYQITAGKDVSVTSDGTDLSVLAALAATASKTTSVSGNLPLLISKNEVLNTIGRALITAGGSAAFLSTLKERTVAVSGQVALAIDPTNLGGDGTAAGAAAMIAVRRNTVKTDLGESTVQAKSGDITVRAKGDDHMYAVTAGAAITTGKTGVNANMIVSVNQNTIHALAGKASLNAVNTTEGTATAGGSVTVEAIGDGLQWAVAGGLNLSYGNSVGPALIVLTAARDVRATAHDLRAWKDVKVIADNTDAVNELSVNVGGALGEGSVTLDTGISVQVLKNRVNAAVASQVAAETGDFILKAKNHSNLDNINVALAASTSKVTATPVFALTYYGGETNALLGSGTVKAAGAAKIIADASKDIDQYTIGAAAGKGKVAVSGAVSLMFLKDTTNALVHHGTSITAGSLEVGAAGDYDLTGASAAIAGTMDGSGAGAAVNAIVTVAKANVLAEMEGSAEVSGAASVTASAKRDIVDLALTAGGGGKAGVGVTVMALVAGDKMDKDAANMLAYGSTDTSGSKIFDSDAMIRKLESLGVNTSDLKAHEEASDPREGSSSRKISGISDDLSGNQSTSYEIRTGEEGKFDASSGMVDQNDFTNDQEMTADERSKRKQAQVDGAEFDPENPDENRELTETADVTRARTAGTSVYSSKPDDAVAARIASGASLTAHGVTVKAAQDSTADLFSATVGAGKELGGAGLGFSIAILRSNVIAASLGTVNVKGGEMAVLAESTSGKGIKDGAEDATAAERSESLRKSFEDAGDVFTRSIRVVGIAAGAGKTGVGIAGSVARADNITQATVGGKITNAAGLTVSGAAKYENVLAVTVAAAGGINNAIAGSVAVAIADGDVGAKLDSSADISGSKTKIHVQTNSVFNVRTGAVSVGGGGKIAGTAGLSLATNHLKQNTSVDRGAVINTAGGELHVTAGSHTTGGSMILGAQFAGQVAVGLGFSLVNVNPEIHTTVGVNPKIGADGREDQKASVSLGELSGMEISNDVYSDATTALISVSGSGQASVAGNVLLVFNETDAVAKIAKAAGNVGSLRVSGNLDASGESTFAQAGMGLQAAIGASVSYVDVNSRNRAVIDTDGFTAKVTGPVEVVTNDVREGKTSAKAVSVSGNMGMVGVGLNAAVARNRALSTAQINGQNGIGGSKVTLKSNGTANAETELVGIVLGEFTVGASIAVSLNEATSLSQMKIGGALEGDLDTSANLAATTHTTEKTGGGSLVGVAVNVAKAQGTSQALVDVDIAKAPVNPQKKNSITSKVTGSNDVNSTILNQNVALGTIAFMAGVAYERDVYDNHVVLRGGDYNLKKLDVTTDYTSKTKAVVNPSALGVDFKLGEATFDMAEAKGKAYARAQAEIIDANVTSEGDVNVTAKGWGSADSGIASTNYFAVKGLSVAGSLARAELATNQAAVLKLNNGKILNAGAVNVKSITDNATTGASHGASGTKDKAQQGFEIKIGDFSLHYVRAKENIASTAMIEGTGGSENNTLKAKSLMVRSGVSENGATSSTAQSKESAELGLVSMGGLDTEARTADRFYTEVAGISAEIAEDVTVYAKGNAAAKSEATAPADVAILALSISHIKAGIGKGDQDRQTAQVLIGDDTKLKSGRAMELYAENNGETNSDYTRNTVSLGSVKYASIPTDSYYSTGVAIGRNAELTSGDRLNIRSLTRPGAVSDLDSLGAGALFDYTSIKGDNRIDDDNNIDIGQGTLLTAVNDVRIHASDNTHADAKTVVRGGGGILGGEVVNAQNTIRRNVGITISNDVSIKSSKADVTVESISGEGDNIIVDAYVRAGGLIAIGKARAVNDISSNNTVMIGSNVLLDAHRNLNLLARATSYTKDGDSNLMEPDHPEDSRTLEPDETAGEKNLSDDEKKQRESERARAQAENDAEREKIIAASDKAKAELEEDELPELQNFGTSNRDDRKPFGVYARANVKAMGAAVWPKAEAANNLRYTAFISINRDNGNQDLDDVEMSELSSHTGDVTVRTDNQGLRAKAESYANGGSIYSDVTASSRITADLQNTIWVDFTNLYALASATENGRRGEVRLLANNFGEGDRPYLVATAEAENSGAFASTDPTALITGLSFNQIKTNLRAGVDVRGEFIHIARNPADCIDYKQQENGKNGTWAFGAAKRRCDFCYEDKGQSSFMSSLESERDPAGVLRRHMEKALIPLGDIQRIVDALIAVNKARFMEEEYHAAETIYVLDLKVPLMKNVTLGMEDLAKYHLWNNSSTYQDVYLLPNATRLWTTGTGLHFIGEVLRGDVLGDGNIYDIDVVTALTPFAVVNPVIGVGSSGALDFSQNTLIIPARADYELYLHEVSGWWLWAELKAGFFRREMAEQAAVNEASLNGTELEEGVLSEEITEDGMLNGWKRFWLGHTPETAEDPEETLVFLLLNEETDEADAFRTSVNMIRNGEDPVDVSLYLYRDGRSDREGNEKYNVLFFDTPEGEKSLFKTVTNTVNGQEMNVPRPLDVMLREFHIEGAEWPAFSLTDHFFVLCDGTDGQVRLFDGFYQAKIKDGTFESDFIRVEGLTDGNLRVTIKNGQMIWPEWAGENAAVDLQGYRYEYTSDTWKLVEERKRILSRGLE